MSRARLWISLTRPFTCLAGGVLCLAGGLSVGATGTGWTVWTAAASTALIVAFAQTDNDIEDVERDRFSRPERPLTGGGIGLKKARLMSIAVALLGVFAGFAARPILLPFASATVVLSWVYSHRLKSTVLFGNCLVAFLASCPILYGVLAARGQIAAALLPQAVVFLFALGFEITKTGRDREDDSKAHLRTIATSHGIATTARVAAVSCLTAVFVGMILLLDVGQSLDLVPVLLGTALAGMTLVASLELFLTGDSIAKLLRAFGHLRLVWAGGVSWTLFIMCLT